MTHLDPELLALLALGEDVADPEERRHLVTCAPCAEELRRLERPVAAARGSEAALVAPRPAVWSGIAEALGLQGRSDPLTAVATPRRPMRRRRALVAAGATLVLVAALIGGALALQPRRVAAADLLAFPDWAGASGTAVLQRLADGSERLQVRTEVRATPDDDHEVWLMTAGARRLVSLGVLQGSTGSFAVPKGLDLDRFDLVDVSAEPRDGNPGHSGDSIVRGRLRS